MIFKSRKSSLGLFVVLGLIGGCSQTPVVAADPSTVVTLVSQGVIAAGTWTTVVKRADSAPGRIDIGNTLVPSYCDEHGYPNGISQSDPNYPGYLARCFMTVDSGDTVLGGFSVPGMVSCMINAAGITYDGVSHEVAVTDEMIAACGLQDSGLTAGFLLNLTGSTPAAFNANFSHGVVVDLSESLGLTFKLATSVSGTVNSFITNESWSDGSIGTTAGTLDTASGDLWYESRVERNACVVSGRCGWNRHTRIRASLTMTGSEPTGLNSVSFGYSNIQFTPGQDSFGGTVITASGDLTDGVKARLWSAGHNGDAQIQPTDASDYDILSNWIEVNNQACFTSTSETANTCGTGLPLFSTNTQFLLNATDSHLPVATWLGTLSGQTYANVDMDADTQF